MQERKNSMTDKVQKIREEVERLKGWNNNVRNSTRHMTLQEEDFNRGKHSSYLEILDFIDSLQDESVSNVWHDMSEEAENGRNIIIIDPKDFYGAVLRKGGSQLRNHNKERYVKWAYIDDIIKLSNVERTGKNRKEEPVNRTPTDVESAMQEVEEKSKAFTEAHKEESADEILAQMRGEEPVSEELEEASKEWLRPQLDKSYANYGETKMMELTHFDGYAMIDAIEFGAKWQKEQNLELTWEDIKTIDKLLNQCVDCNNPYQEVLKRFKDLRQS